MFLYWEGYEIDGSDTDFEIILPESKQILEFIECFLSIPVFNQTLKPHIYSYKNRKSISYTKNQLKEMLLSGNYSDLFININCDNTDQIEDHVKQQLFLLSEGRVPHEAAYKKVKNPCMAPVKQSEFTQSSMAVSLYIQKPNKQNIEKETWGLVRNGDLFLKQGEHIQSFSINVGPGFYYEYAMFIIHYLTDHFPSLGVCGGLDCANGWTNGCTYSNSIYAYEKIRLPIKYNVNHMLKYLRKYHIVFPCETYYRKVWIYEKRSDFPMVNCEIKENNNKEHLRSFSEYHDLILNQFEHSNDYCTNIHETAVAIMLPEINEFQDNPKVCDALTKALPKEKNFNHLWYYTGYMAFSSSENQPICELRIHWPMKEYAQTLLELAELGELEFMKEKTYRERQID